MYSSMIDNTDCYFIELCTCMGSCLSQLRMTLYAEPIDFIIIYCTQDVEHPRYTRPFNEIKTMFYAKICLTFLNENQIIFLLKKHSFVLKQNKKKIINEFAYNQFALTVRCKQILLMCHLVQIFFSRNILSTWVSCKTGKLYIWLSN